MVVPEFVAQVMQSNGDICMPKEVVYAAIAGYAGLGTAIAVQWRAKLKSDDRIAAELAIAQERLFEVLKEKQQRTRQKSREEDAS